MTTNYDTAVEVLYRAPHNAFVAERKRLASELKAAGDKEGAARLGKLGRPPLSAWAVNQLWWQARDAFEELFASAARLRAGDHGALGLHREALATLRSGAAKILSTAGHAATEATLRRIAMTLSALAASGGFEPDPPGALTLDRDPPGFEAVGVADVSVTNTAASETSEGATAKRTQEAAEARARAEAEAERRRVDEERARKRAERARLESSVRAAKDELSLREREQTRLQNELRETETRVTQARSALAELQARLAGLETSE